MSVTVRYFARMAEIAGVTSQAVAPLPATAADLFTRIDAQHDFGFDRTHLRVAINDRLVGWDQALTDGDEVALIPPVSGG